MRLRTKTLIPILTICSLSLALPIKSQANNLFNTSSSNSYKSELPKQNTTYSENDFSVWGLIFAKYGVIPKKLTLTFVGEFRGYNNVSTFDMAHGFLGADYHICKYFTIGAGYHIFGNKIPSSSDYFFMHGPELSAMGLYSVAGFSFILLERFNPFWLYINPDKPTLDMQIRNLAMIKYHIPNTIISPLIGVEPFVQLNNTHKWEVGDLAEIRYMLGADFKFNKHNSLCVKGILVNKGAVKPTLYRYTICLDYILSF